MTKTASKTWIKRKPVKHTSFFADSRFHVPLESAKHSITLESGVNKGTYRFSETEHYHIFLMTIGFSWETIEELTLKA